jgi:hypothetical protein
MTFTAEAKKSTLKFTWKHRRLWIANSWYHNPRLQIILLSHSNKSTWYCHTNRHRDQWKRRKDPVVNLHSYSHLSFDKGAKIYDGETIASSINPSG